ncbi:hypothetical protein F7Q91_02805 [Vibrio chagasii]|uniref:Uncharacterized protein n=1 Tax=Vibrio chagasii TaxID=170679 RepID=A0A7V7NWX3_9VIBR|nr:hypothetical protein [Vibrio chagasii]KAB0482350.1 hypothetical protein F7Q91_02805 [Vibrio chagasii]
MNIYQVMLTELLKTSTLTRGKYSPSDSVKNGHHVAVFVGHVPVILCGPASCKKSHTEAYRLSQEPAFQKAMSELKLSGKVSSGTVFGAEIDWQDEYEAILKSKSGVSEAGGEGELIAINLSQSLGLSTLICVNDSLAKIFDSQCPRLQDGIAIALLAESHMSNK